MPLHSHCRARCRCGNILVSVNPYTFRLKWEGNEALRGPAVRQPPSSGAVRTLEVDASHGSILEGQLTWGSDTSTAIVFKTPNATEPHTSEPAPGAPTAVDGGFLRLSAGSAAGRAWSTLDLGKVGGPVGSAIASWKNNSHQGITADAPEPTRGLGFKTGDKVSWRLLYRQGLYEICASHGSIAVCVCDKP